MPRPGYWAVSSRDYSPGMTEPPKTLPPPVTAARDRSTADLWRSRLRQHTSDSYAGITLSKFPEDLRVYEHLLWLDQPNVVIEIGAQFGASTLWFRDRLRTLASYGRIEEPRVIAIELAIDLLEEHLEGAHAGHLGDIELVGGDVTDVDLPARIEELLRPGDRCIVIEDSAHVYETTKAALDGFARFIPPGGFFVVEDGCVDVDELRISPDWPRGVLPAIQDWLATAEGSNFKVRFDLEAYGITCHPGGYLQRLGNPAGRT
jgi:cephalosporin hydroxylase